jgi:CDP-glycerol glycerophosphotransferase (TagB/SpsB family)/glycosyltransferase involved in cell wall biosynthesis
MPVYNVERYLRACLESVVTQTLEGIEIIAVNDGSTDGSLKILEEYRSSNPDRMKVFTTENRGVSHARNFGLARASGEYVLFVDSDDFIEREMCEKLYAKAVKDNNDIVVCGRYNVYEREDIGEVTKEATKTSLINRNFKLSEHKYELAHISPFPWDKLFRRSLLEGLQFPEKMRFEDLVLVFEVCCRTDTIGVVEEPLYNYRRTTQGGFLNSFSEQTLDIVKAFELLFAFMKQNGCWEIFYEELEYICAKHFIYRYPALFKGSNKGKLALKIEIIRKTQDFLDKELPSWRSNHYLRYSSGTVKRKLKLYTNRKRMIRLTRIREFTPESVMRIFMRRREEQKRWKKRLQKFKRSSNRLALVKKRLPIIGILLQSGPVYYTRMYEKLRINPKDILFESKHGEDIAGNIFALLRELADEPYKEYRVLLAMEKDYMEQNRELLENYGLTHVTMLDIRSRAYAKALASAKYLVTDTSFPPYYIKKMGQVYLNTWHGTPLKAMGRIVPMREYALGNVQRNYLIADYLLYQNDFSKEAFQNDYMIKDIFQGTALICGYPRNSTFFHKNRYNQIRQELSIEDKQVIVYMPTWRGLLHKKETKKQLEMLGVYFTQIDGRLTDDQVFYVKLHPYVKDEMDYGGYRHIMEFPHKYETYDFLNASDVLVTDYSSIMFDYGVTKRKIVLFTYDREEYRNGRGLYFDLEELELPKADTVEALIAELRAENKGYPKFFEKFCSYDSINTPRQVIETLLYGEARETQQYKAERSLPSGKEKVFIFIKGLKQDHYSDRLIDSINRIDLNKYEVYVCMKANNVKNASQMLSRLKREVNYFPITYEISYTIWDYILSKLRLVLGVNIGFANKRNDRIMNREIRKNFGEAAFDYVIHHSELDRMVGHMCCLLGKTTIYNFKYFNMSKYKEDGAHRKQVKYFVRRFPLYTAVVATKEFKLLHKKADNILYNEEAVFPMAKILTEVAQHEGRSYNISQRQ